MKCLKSKMCGGDLTLIDNQSISTCEFCGSKQTIPNTNDEKKVKLYNNANELRINADFDKAYMIYQLIITEYENEAEAFWGLCMCKYGILYVNDYNGEKIPTINRISVNSILEDEDYLKSIECADVISRELYIKHANLIDSIQKKVLFISNKEEPYDIFICYKETDSNGERTQDSVIAQDMFEELSKIGYKVFFARITLESKLGTEYEPVIFSALKSSKVMLVVGSKIDYFNSPWVKNEWSRFINFIKEDKGRYLIPCYKDIDAYDMPKEFLQYQSQNINKIGFLQDLVRGINKIFNKEEKSNNTNAKFNKAEIDDICNCDELISKGNFKEARKIEKKLDIKFDSTKHSELYDSDGFPIPSFHDTYARYVFIKYKIYYKVSIEKYYGLDELVNKLKGTVGFTKNDTDVYLSEALIYSSDDDFKSVLQAFIINCRESLKSELYNELVEKIKIAKTAYEFYDIYNEFKIIKDYKDSSIKRQYCLNKSIKLDNPNSFIYKMLTMCITPTLTQEQARNYLEGFKNISSDCDCQKYIDYLERYIDNDEGIQEKISWIENEINKIYEEQTNIKHLEEKINLYQDKINLLQIGAQKELKNYSDTLEQKENILSLEIKHLNEQLDNCGFFNFRLKKQLNNNIISSELKLSQLKEMNKNLKTLKEQEISTNLKKESEFYDNEIIKIKDQIYEIKINTGLIELESQLEKYKSILSEKNNKIPCWEPSRFYIIKDRFGFIIPCIKLGIYPRYKITNPSLLFKLSETNEDLNGFYTINGLKCVKKENDFFVLVPILWKILGEFEVDKENYYNLQSLYAIEERTYNDKNNLKVAGKSEIVKKDGSSAFEYEASDVRKWLNNELYTLYFNKKEQELLLSVGKINKSLSYLKNDKIYLPSKDEIIKSDFFDFFNTDYEFDEIKELINYSYDNAKRILKTNQISIDENLHDLDDFYVNESNFNAQKEMCLNYYIQTTAYASAAYTLNVGDNIMLRDNIHSIYLDDLNKGEQSEFSEYDYCLVFSGGDFSIRHYWTYDDTKVNTGDIFICPRIAIKK